LLGKFVNQKKLQSQSQSQALLQLPQPTLLPTTILEYYNFNKVIYDANRLEITRLLNQILETHNIFAYAAPGAENRQIFFCSLILGLSEITRNKICEQIDVQAYFREQDAKYICYGHFSVHMGIHLSKLSPGPVHFTHHSRDFNQLKYRDGEFVFTKHFGELRPSNKIYQIEQIITALITVLNNPLLQLRIQ